MSCGLSSGQVEISGASAFCIGFLRLLQENDALNQKVQQPYPKAEIAFS
jgi:hypothetical protein